MKIANPIYDTVFKYLMEDERIARTILSALLKVDVVAVEVRPHEYSDDNRDSLSVFRIDFGATVRDRDGNSYIITIILKKIRFADEPSCLMISIFGLPKPFTTCIDIEGVTFQRLMCDRYYKVLNLFHQMYQIDGDKHMLTQLESIYSKDEDLLHILYYLQTLLDDSTVSSKMAEEDHYTLCSNRKEMLEWYEARYLELSSTIKEQGDTIKEQGDTIKEQGALLRSTIKLLLDAGMTPDQIASKLGVSHEAVDCML